MTDEWILSVADVAEALSCETDEVMELVHSGELRAESRNPVTVHHSVLREFVRESQERNFLFGDARRFTPSLDVSQPGGVAFGDES